MHRWIGVLALLAVVAMAHAQTFRQLPANGQVGNLTGGQQLPYPLLQINNQTVRLAPGGRIYDENNRLIVHGALPPSAPVVFVADSNGDVSRVYILRIDEFEQLQQRLQRQQ